MIEERLLVVLREHANPRGIVVMRGSTLVQEAQSTQVDIDSALASLSRAGVVTVLAPFPFLVLRLHSWSGMFTRAAGSVPPAYGYSKLSSNHVRDSYSPDDALLDEILETLGETDRTSFEGAIKNFAPDVIRKALDRVRRTTAVRKNRTALFRYLLTKLS
jgi:hypothetical protein